MSADLFGLPHAESFTGLDQAPTPPPSGTIRSMQCASWGPQGALRGTNGVSAEIVVTLGCEICCWLKPGTQTTSPRDKKMQAMCLLEPLGGEGTYRDLWGMIWADSMGLSDSEFLLDYINFVFSVL